MRIASSSPLRIVHEAGDARLRQLLPGAVAPGDADGSDAVGPGADGVVLPVADHDGARRIEALPVEDVPDEIALVGVAVVELRAVDLDEGAGEAEMLEDPPREDIQLRRGDVEAKVPFPKLTQQSGNARIDLVLEQADIAVALPVEAHGLLHVMRSAQKLGEAGDQRRPDHPGQRIRLGNGASQSFERILDRARDAHFRIRQGSVEVEERDHSFG